MIAPAPHTTTSRKLKRVILSWELLRDLFTEGLHPANAYRVVRDALPNDAMLVNVRLAWPHCLEALIYSERFAAVNEGDEYPLLNPVCERIAV